MSAFHAYTRATNIQRSTLTIQDNFGALHLTALPHACIARRSAAGSRRLGAARARQQPRLPPERLATALVLRAAARARLPCGARLLLRGCWRGARCVASRAGPSMALSGGGVSTVLWFRKGLRLHDNPALLAAVSGASAVHPLFILDPHFLTPEHVGAARLRFLLESLADLDASLRARNSRLIVLHGARPRQRPRACRARVLTCLCVAQGSRRTCCPRRCARGARAASASSGTPSRTR